jgi:hypothetical protein
MIASSAAASSKIGMNVGQEPFDEMIRLQKWVPNPQQIFSDDEL